MTQATVTELLAERARMQRPAQILVVDDNPHMVTLLRRWLERAGYHVTGLTTIPEAITALTAQAPTWVITDLHLPSGSALELLAYVRAQQLRTSVIVMTGFGAEAMRQQVLAAGAYAFLSKPFGSDALLTLLAPKPSSLPR
jgi:DNA-binding NtrC family response regulator